MYRPGMDLYFKRHDGHAVTCDDFLAAMADANGQDLSGLAKWWVMGGLVGGAAATALLPGGRGGAAALPCREM